MVHGLNGRLPSMTRSKAHPSTSTDIIPKLSIIWTTVGSFHPWDPLDHSKLFEPPRESATASANSLNLSTCVKDFCLSSSNLKWYSGSLCFAISCHGLHFVRGSEPHKWIGPSSFWMASWTQATSWLKRTGSSMFRNVLVIPKYGIPKCLATLEQALLSSQQNLMNQEYNRTTGSRFLGSIHYRNKWGNRGKTSFCPHSVTSLLKTHNLFSENNSST